MKPLSVLNAAAILLTLTLPLGAQHDHPREDRGQEPRAEHPRGRQEGRPERAPRAPAQLERMEPRRERLEPQRESQRIQEPDRLERRGREWPARSQEARGREDRGNGDRPQREERRRREDPREGVNPFHGSGRGDYPVQMRTRQDARSWQSQRGWQQNGSWQPHNSWRENRVQNWEAAHRAWAQRGGYGGYYIPQERFYAYYGPRNYFAFRPVIYMGYPRFWYGQYWFQIVDPWPYDWDEDWYDSGDCYIDFVDGGYYLYNRRHPDIALAVSVSL